MIAIRSSAALGWRDRASKPSFALEVKTLLKRRKHPPVGEEAATELVLEQAKLFIADLLGAA